MAQAAQKISARKKRQVAPWRQAYTDRLHTIEGELKLLRMAIVKAGAITSKQAKKRARLRFTARELYSFRNEAREIGRNEDLK